MILGSFILLPEFRNFRADMIEQFIQAGDDRQTATVAVDVACSGIDAFSAIYAFKTCLDHSQQRCEKCMEASILDMAEDFDYPLTFAEWAFIFGLSDGRNLWTEFYPQ